MHVYFITLLLSVTKKRDYRKDIDYKALLFELEILCCMKRIMSNKSLQKILINKVIALIGLHFDIRGHWNTRLYRYS